MNSREKFIAFLTILTKETRRIMRIWVQTIFPPAITMSLYFLIFGTLIGRRIGEMGGFDYMEFIVPGLIMMSVITNSYANVVSSFFSAKYQNSLEEMLVSPLPNYIILLGYIAGGVIRGMVVGVAVVTVSLFFHKLRIDNIWVVISIAFLTATLFSLAGFINAIFAQKFDHISIVPTFVLTPLTYLGGIFYSTQLLGPFWQKVTMANPIFYMVNGFRKGMLGESDIPLWVSYSIIIGFVLVLFSISLHLLNKGTGIRS